MDYRILEFELCICRLRPDARFPQPEDTFFSISRTPTELSLVCRNPPPDAEKIDAGWSALEVIGPLDFALTGILASFAAPLAKAEISIFAISTFDTDYLLVKPDRLDAVVNTLAAAGHRCIGGSRK